jgi:hypothetical protein
MSLGDGGKIFSMYAMKNINARTPTGGNVCSQEIA